MSIVSKKLKCFSPLMLCGFIAVLVSACGGGSSSNSDSIASAVISNSEIKWSFSTTVQSGTFANGDYWVVGPVTIIGITPSYNGNNNGFEINPTSTTQQGFDVRIDSFSTSLIPSLPYKAMPGQSIVKVASVDASDTNCRPCIQSVSVMTVLSEAPPNNGSTIFRPPYFGTDKPLYSTDDINYSLLPNYTPTGSALSFSQVANQYKQVQLDHKTGWTGRHLHPIDSMPDYGSAIAYKNTESALALMLEGTNSEKSSAVINYINNGIDIYHMLKNGTTWPAAGGHGEGRKLPVIIAAVLLEDNAMKNFITNTSSVSFGETSGVYYSTTADMNSGKVLWGQVNGTEKQYWERLVLEKGSKTYIDPYKEIDGGEITFDGAGGYQFCCTSIVWENIVTALELMPSLKPVFNFPNLKVYTDRWMASGYHTQPDSCAPPTGFCSGGNNAGASCTTANATSQCTGTGASCDIASSYATDYGVTYGSDGSGGCIQDLDSSDGIGRLPQLHGTSAGLGSYGSAFAAEMKAAYLP